MKLSYLTFIHSHLDQSRMCARTLGRPATRTHLFAQSQPRAWLDSECQASAAQHYQFVVRPTDWLPDLCLATDHLLCREQRPAESGDRATDQLCHVQARYIGLFSKVRISVVELFSTSQCVVTSMQNQHSMQRGVLQWRQRWRSQRPKLCGPSNAQHPQERVGRSR